MSARLAPLALAATLLAGCRNACEADCQALPDFYEACADELADAGYPLWCYDEVEAHPDGTIDREHRRECDDGRDARDSCLHISHARADALPKGDNDDRLEECADETDLDRAIREGDCEAAIAALAADSAY
jgi:hypothetical protein